MKPIGYLSITTFNGDHEKTLDGKLHCETGPAIEKSNGDKYWYINGKLHREDGPAIEKADGSFEWRLNGQLHCDKIDPITHDFIPAIYDKEREREEWWVNGKRHRINAPAIVCDEYADFDLPPHKEWWVNGQLHREDGAAIESYHGNLEWHLNG